MARSKDPSSGNQFICILNDIIYIFLCFKKETTSQNGARHRGSLHLETEDGQVLPLRLRA